jgi:2-methylcitrate dehydratase PrpD
MEGHLAALGAWVAKLSYDDIPERTRRAAKMQLANMIAAACAARESNEIAPVVTASRATRGADGRARVVATGERAPLLDAVVVNAACSMAQDFDDIVWMGHTCHSAIWAPLAVAEHEDKSGRELVTAIVAANEVGGRIGASSFLGPLNGQMWTFIHLAGAAAGTARLLGLDADRTTHALAISLAQPNFALQPGFLKPTSKLLAAATPAASGVSAAYLARGGMTGAPGILEDRRGFWKRFSFLPMPFMLSGLGEQWVTDTLQIKTYPGCHYFQTALTAIEALRARGLALSTDATRAVRIDTTKLAVEATRFAKEYVEEDGRVTPVSCAFNLAQSAAILLAAGRLTTREIDEAWLDGHARELGAWLARIEVRHDLALTARVVRSASRMTTGREALAWIRLRDLAVLRERYAAEYASTLLSARDLTALVRRAVAGEKAERGGEGAPAEGAALMFPARVTVTPSRGKPVAIEVDVPVGAIALSGAARALEEKFAACVGDARLFAATQDVEGCAKVRRDLPMVAAASESHAP